MTNDHLSDPSHEDEEYMAEFIRALDSTAPPVDREFLDRLRERTTEEFLRHAAKLRPAADQSPRPVVWNARWVAVAVALVIVLASFMFAPPANQSRALAFGEVLSKVTQADTLHLQVTRDGKTEELWIRQPGQLRWQTDPARYRIVQGSRLWKVDENEKVAVDEESPYFAGPNSTFDVLELLQVKLPDEPPPEFRRLPGARTRREGKECHVYQLDIPPKEGDEAVRLEALVEVGTNELRWLETQVRRQGRFVPVNEIRVVALNRPIDDEKFIVGQQLTQDGRIGKITDVQGLVTIKPVMNRRWTPVDGPMLVEPGDWLRTDVRGPNAVAVKLEEGAMITLGPGSLIELIKADDVRLLYGEAQFAPQRQTLTLRGPGKESRTVRELQRFRVNDQKLAAVADVPKWLAGFEGTIVNETMGSLIAKVDTRDVPLTIGSHNVRVEIRDQIARTTIEESFVNHTDDRLEGVFHFPLPADASISGFGMWIGGELVEADIIEKQRAREIYETILREKRDPGLLEWTGGNIFKARVYPILPHAEKRIKITYTQVLPLRGNQYRYSYGLQSEMLRQTPLRDLSIDLKVYSAMPLKSVSCPTHPTRTDMTEHAGHIEFAAQEYRPTRDFEAVIEVADRQADVVMIPHRRGEDGYFLMQVMPPAGEGRWERDVLPNSEPLELLLVADTSGSMDRAQRERQREFIATLLSSLAPRDRFNVVCTDVDAQWIFQEPVAASDDNLATVRAFLDGRVSLGWTDLEAAFKQVLSRVKKRTQVIYVGDGIATTTTADPVGFSERLKPMYRGDGTFHAVATGNSYESSVLQTIASLGGGSWRAIDSEQGPRGVATELLEELSRPVLRDVQVEFQGLQVAAVYPAQLPNVPVGQQQIVLGRYLPEGQDQTGAVIVTGKLAGEPVRYRSRVTLADAEAGNSFIPRLWARKHLDQLLAQGRSQEIQDEIIALSEEFHIMTPYTSLLVLETDADRERFKVKRRFQMRDGERFFAKGRDDANYELRQQQMRAAGEWRIELRSAVLQEIAAMGRTIPVTSTAAAVSVQEDPVRVDRLGRSRGRFYTTRGDRDFTPNLWYGNGIQNGSGVERWDVDADGLVDANEALNQLYFRKEFSESNGPVYPASLSVPMPVSLRQEVGQAGDSFADFDAKESKLFVDAHVTDGPAEMGTNSVPSRRRAKAGFAIFGGARDDFYGESDTMTLLGLPGVVAAGRNRYVPPVDDWLNNVVPALPSAPPPIKPLPPLANWSQEAIELANGLLRNEKLADLSGGLEIKRTTESVDPRWQNVTFHAERLELVSPRGWLVRNDQVGTQTLVQWCDEQQRGVVSQAFELGRFRTAQPEDLKQPPLDLQDFSTDSLTRRYARFTATVKQVGEQRAELFLVDPRDDERTITVLIDTNRHVVLKVTTASDGEPQTAAEFSEHVDVGGMWWPQKITSINADGQQTRVVQQTVTALAAEAFGQRMQTALALREHALLLPQPLPSLHDARLAIAGGDAQFEHYLTMLLHHAATQQWERVWNTVPAAQRAAAEKPGFRFLRDQLLRISRRHVELQQRVLAEARRLAAQPRPDDYFLVRFLTDHISNIFQYNERLAFHDVVKPVYDRQPDYADAPKQWALRRARMLDNSGRSRAALELSRQLAVTYPRDANLQESYAHNLMHRGDYGAAYQWLEQALAADPLWNETERFTLRNAYAEFLRAQSRYPQLVAWLAESVAADPSGLTVYEQYLDALLWNGQLEEAEAAMSQWLALGVQPERLTDPQRARISAAIRLATGQGFRLRTDRLLDKWQQPLAEIVRQNLKNHRRLDLVTQLMNNSLFANCEAADAIRQEFTEQLPGMIDELSEDQIGAYVGWLLNHSAFVVQSDWQAIVDKLRPRWNTEQRIEQRRQLGGTLQRIYLQKFDLETRLEFLRARLARTTAEYHLQDVAELFQTLLAQPWSQAWEDELWTLVPSVPDHLEPAQQLSVQVDRLRKLVDRQVQGRFDAAWSEVEDPEKLTRPAYRERRVELMTQARTAVADRLAQELAQQPPPLRDWMQAERNYLNVTLNRHLDQVADDCWQVLGAVPPVETEETRRDGTAALRRRALLTVMNLALRKTAEPADVERLSAYIDAGITGDDAEEWRMAKYHWFVALDRADELDAALRTWIRESEYAHNWRVALGRLVAERGQLQEAVQLFETVARDEELSPGDYRLLSQWYMALGRRDDYERTLLRMFDESSVDALNHWLQYQLRSQRGNSTITEVDPQVVAAFRSMLRRATMPQQYVSQLQQYYQLTHDFRLLEGLAESVVGYTPEQIYPFLQRLSSVFGEIRDEATADELLRQIQVLRQRADSATDQRALDLLEVLVERRAAEMMNQPGPHTTAAVAALQRAFEREWAAGEPELMAEFLHSMGRISARPLANEQLRQLHALYQRVTPGTPARLSIGYRLAMASWSYGEPKTALAWFEVILREYEQHNDDQSFFDIRNPLNTYIDYLQSGSHFAAAEAVVNQWRDVMDDVEYERQLNNIYLRAMQARGSVSLGRGEELYGNLRDRLKQQFASAADNRRSEIVSQLCGLFQTAHDQKIAAAREDVKGFAFGELPDVLKTQSEGYENIIGRVTDTLSAINGPYEALAFLIPRVDFEPARYRYSQYDGWARFGGRIIDLRMKTADLGELTEPLANLLGRELRRGLRSRRLRHAEIFQRDRREFWNAQAPAFEAAAEAVLAEHRDSAEVVPYVANYLYDGLHKYDRAIEIYFQADDRGLLDDQAKYAFAILLQQRDRHGESVPLLRSLVERQPTNREFRSRLIEAYHGAHRREDMIAFIDESDTYFHENNLWNEANIAMLAEGCLVGELDERAIGYFDEVIALHRRARHDRVQGDGTLSNYYIQLSTAHARLGRTEQAVEAASGAIVCWGPRQQQREHAVENLVRILTDAADRDDVAARLDAEAAQSGQDRPIVRKALGQAYLNIGQQQPAARQFELAVELQSDDVETHTLLLDAYRKLGDRDRIIAQLRRLIDLQPRQLEWYPQLAAQYSADALQQERAYTSIVEALPHETESHVMLAAIREKQDNWNAAIAHWQAVAQIRKLEPTGLIGLAKAQLHQQQWIDAEQTIRRLEITEWPERFETVPEETRQLRWELSRRRK